MTVKRYDFGTEYRGRTGVPGIVGKANGRYVRYDDYAELESQLEAIGAGGVSAGQKLMTREAVGLQAPSVALLLKIKAYTAACVERLDQPEIDRRWADICSAARDYAAEQVELDRQRRGEPSGYAYRYADGIRFTDGCEVNGSRPIETVPYWFAPQAVNPVELAKGALREFVESAKEAGIECLDLAHIYADPENAPSDAEIMSLAYDVGSMPEQMTDGALLRFARALLAQYGQPLEPEGWQLVPKEATEAMVRAAHEEWSLGVKEMYIAMLRDAPEPPCKT